MHILTKVHCPKFKDFLLTGVLRDSIKFENQSEKSLRYLVDSMPWRLEDIIRREGNPTNY
jgi:hypothetical protein